MSNESDFGPLEDRVESVENTLLQLKKDLESNTATTKRIESNTEDLVAAFEALKGAFKVLEFIGKVGKPLLYISGATTGLIALWTLIKRIFNF